MLNAWLSMAFGVWQETLPGTSHVTVSTLMLNHLRLPDYLSFSTIHELVDEMKNSRGHVCRVATVIKEVICSLEQVQLL